jgi:hypothetical protein
VKTPATGANSVPVVNNGDVAAVRDLIERSRDTDFFRDRRVRNVALPPPNFSRADFWRILVGCLLTTQQRSTKGSAVDRFLEIDTFPLALNACEKQPSVQIFVSQTLESFGGIRRGVTISSQAEENWKRLEGGLWKDAEEWFAKLRQQRLREPQNEHRLVEREAAHWADESFAGLGPKQSRNLWQWLGLTRYEIPLDSRVTEWVNGNLASKIEAKRLGQLGYYESALDSIQAICEKAGALPCELDAAAFDYEDLGLGSTRRTTETGFVNPNGQVTIRNTGLPGTDHNQYVYQIACSHCGEVYGANGSDIFERKCPRCQQGKAGLSLGNG